MARVTFFSAYPHVYGGAERALQLLASGLGERGWTVEVLFPATGVVPELLAAASIPTDVVETPPSLRVYGKETKGRRAVTAGTALPAYWGRVRRRVAGRTDVLHILGHRGMVLAGPAGRRHVAAKDFFIDIMTTALDPGEVLVALNIPRPKPGAQFRYRKIRHPASGYAVVGVAVALCLQDSMVSEATIGITGATGRAFAAEAASTHLIGKPLSSQTITSAALLASEQAECLSDHYAPANYRKHLLKTEVIRALASLSAV